MYEKQLEENNEIIPNGIFVNQHLGGGDSIVINGTAIELHSSSCVVSGNQNPNKIKNKINAYASRPYDTKLIHLLVVSFHGDGRITHDEYALFKLRNGTSLISLHQIDFIAEKVGCEKSSERLAERLDTFSKNDLEQLKQWCYIKE